MKLLSEFIKDLQALKEKHGDLPVVTQDLDGYTTIHDNDSLVKYDEQGAFLGDERVPCLVISW